MGRACPVAGRSCTFCSVIDVVTGFDAASALELEKGHIVGVDVGIVYIKDFGSRNRNQRMGR